MFDAKRMHTVSRFSTTAGNAEVQWTAYLTEWQKVASEAKMRWQQFKLDL